jgi:hypothetical protein
LKRIIAGTVLAFAALALAGCDDGKQTSATNADQTDSNVILQKFRQVQPPPQFDWSQIRQTLIDVETAQAKTTQTTSFFFNQGVREPVYTCPSLGFPVAATSELTNPQQPVSGFNDRGYGLTTVGQIDPNGIFPGNSTGTYVLCVGPNGKVTGQYAEEFVHTVVGPAKWDDATKQIVSTGDPTFKFTTKK